MCSFLLLKQFSVGKFSYTDTRKFLLDLVTSDVDLADVNIGTIDPIHPQWPRRIDLALAKTSGRRFLVKDGVDGQFELLKIVRKVSPVAISVSHPRLATELAKIRTTKSENANCLICDDENTMDDIVTCIEGHIFCQLCLNDYAQAKIQDGVTRGYLECMQQDCSAPFSQSLPFKLRFSNRISYSSFRCFGCQVAE